MTSWLGMRRNKEYTRVFKELKSKTFPLRTELEFSASLTLKQQVVHHYSSSLDSASSGWYTDVPVSMF